MARILYFDCFSGISGDMVLGACLDAGMPLDDLRAALGSLAIGGYEIGARRVLRAGISATHFEVREGDSAGHQHPHRHLAEIARLIDRSALSATGRARAQALFQRLGAAEAAIHDMPIERVHLHEVGALDSIIDIVGAVFAMEWAAADRIVCSPLNVGGGTVQTAHGVLPVPAPATVRLLGDAPIYSGEVQKELVTPTGALLATDYATSFGSVPAMRIERVGYGAGSRDHAGSPNVLRVLIGRSAAAGDEATEPVLVLECEIDDMNPQLFGVVMERLYAAGALDVYYVPVQMKKNRPGTLLTVIAAPADGETMAAIIFAETTTLGLRRREVIRERLARTMLTVETPLGAVRFKVASRHGQVVNATPEFDDCAALAAAHGRSVKDVQRLALQAYAAGTR